MTNLLERIIFGIFVILISKCKLGKCSSAICEFDGSTGSGEIIGQVLLEEDYGVVTIQGYLSGFSGKGLHGFHIHELGKLGNDCHDAKGHFNPRHVIHGGPYDLVRHVGDLGNIEADATGVAHVDIADDVISLSPCINSVMGRSIVVHENEDDLGRGYSSESRKTGNAGARLACCIIKEIP